MASRASGQDSLVGSELGHYHVVEKIGAGGIREVYRARDQHLARDVAIKVLPPGTLTDESARKHFRKEALILSQLNHPNIATIYDFDTQLGVDFLVMEYIPGITLSEKVAAGPSPEKDVLRLGVQLAEGLTAAHEHGIAHRDLKPGNLRVTSDGWLKILDFGLAKLWRPVTASAATESLGETQAMAGTLPYMAPEQLLGGEIDARTDLHAAGSVLYEMATGQRPFAEVERSQLIGAILQRSPVPPAALNPKLSPELVRIIGKCLEKDAENRYQSAKELAIDLRRLGDPSTSATPVQRGKQRTPNLILVAGALLATVCVALFALNVGGWRDRLLGKAAPPDIRSLAVLPLENLSGNPGEEYFADGMTDALITELGKIQALSVISRQSVMQYKGTNKSVPQIARELHVDAVVEGSTMRAGDKVRIAAQLVRANPERHLWSESYERDLRDVLTLQGNVARAIVSEINIKVTAQEHARLARSRPVNLEAYEAYLKGAYILEKRTPNDIRRATEFFQQAIEIDPNYAMGYIGLAVSYSLSGTRSRMELAARKALELDDTLAVPHALLATLRLERDWDWAGAEKEFTHALELEPGNATIHYWYGFIYLFPAGRLDEGIAEMKRALELAPLSLPINANLGIMLRERDEGRSGSFDDAIEQCRKTLELDSNFTIGQMCLGQAYQVKGMYEEAATQLSRCAASGIFECRRKLAVVYVLAGRTTEALKLLGEMRERYKKQPEEAYNLWEMYAALGDREQAFTWLEKSYEQREFNMLYIRYCTTDPAVKDLTSDPRFQDVVRRMNFPQ